MPDALRLAVSAKTKSDDRFDSVADFQALFLHQRQVIRIEPFFQRFGIGTPLAQAVVPLGNVRTLVPEKLQLRVIERVM